MCVIRDIASIVVAISAATGVIVAIKGLSTWQEQLKGQSEYDAAKNLLLSIIKVERTIRVVRNPSMPTWEIEAAFADNGIHSLEQVYSAPHGNLISYVYNRRWARVITACREYENNYLVMSVYLPQQLEEQNGLLCGIVNTLSNDISAFINSEGDWSQVDLDNDELIAMKNRIYGRSSNDIFKVQIEQVVESFKAILSNEVKMM